MILIPSCSHRVGWLSVKAQHPRFLRFKPNFVFWPFKNSSKGDPKNVFITPNTAVLVQFSSLTPPFNGFYWRSLINHILFGCMITRGTTTALSQPGEQCQSHWTRQWTICQASQNIFCRSFLLLPLVISSPNYSWPNISLKAELSGTLNGNQNIWSLKLRQSQPALWQLLLPQHAARKLHGNTTELTPSLQLRFS